MTLRTLWLMAQGRREQQRRHMVEQAILDNSIQSGRAKVDRDEFAKQGIVHQMTGRFHMPNTPNISREINRLRNGNGSTA